MKYLSSAILQAQALLPVDVLWEMVEHVVGYIRYFLNRQKIAYTFSYFLREYNQ